MASSGDNGGLCCTHPVQQVSGRACYRLQ